MRRLLIVLMVLGLVGCGPDEKVDKVWEVKTHTLKLGLVIYTFKHKTTGLCLVRSSGLVEVPTAICEEEE